MNRLRVSVGPGKPNAKPDVAIVQSLLNRSRVGLAPDPLRVDGEFGPETAARIYSYQAQVLGMRQPNGVVDPGERTHKALLRGNEVPIPVFPTVALVEVSENRGRTPTVDAFLKSSSPAAQAVAARWHVPASVVLGHSALYTGWGVFASRNNYFGMQAKINSGGTVRPYASYAESADDFARFLRANRRYDVVFLLQNKPVAFAYAGAFAGMHADPSWGSWLNILIESCRLGEFDV